MVKSIRDYIASCPLLKDGKLNVDYLGNEPTEYVIEVMPTSEIIQSYIDGSSVRQCSFIFGSREFWGSNAIENMENSDFYEEFSAWLEKQSKDRNLPLLDGGKKAASIEALTSGYMFNGEAAQTARYQIQCRLIYNQK